MSRRDTPATHEDRTVLVLMPAYNEARSIHDVVTRVRSRIPDVLVIDDGSTDETAECARAAGADVIRFPENQGKGTALSRGFDEARDRGFDAVLTMDADGQHAPEDLPRFLEAYRQGSFPVLIGNRMADVAAMPWIRRMTNRFMSWLLSRLMGQAVPDTQNGFRLYRLDALEAFRAQSSRFDAESEILLFLARNRFPIGSIPVSTVYGEEVSKVHPVRDTYRFVRMLYQDLRLSKSALDADEEFR